MSDLVSGSPGSAAPPCRCSSTPIGSPPREFRGELEEAAREFEAVGDEANLATVETETAWIDWMPCRFDRASQAARDAVEHPRRSGDPSLLADALLPLVAAQMFGLRPRTRYAARLDELRDDLSRTRRLDALILVIRAFSLSMGGSFDEARRLMQTAFEMVEGLGLGFAIAAHYEALGELELRAGDAAAAERAFHRNYETLDEMHDEAHKSTGAANLARKLCALGRFSEAERYAAIAVSVAAPDDLISQAYGRSARATALAAPGEFDEAERVGREAWTCTRTPRTRTPRGTSGWISPRSS